MNEKSVVDALIKIANYPSGGVIKPGSVEADRDDMIHTARQALRDIGYTKMRPDWVWKKIDGKPL